MRIIAGKFRGRRLAAVGGAPVRPTADRTREALFSILGGLVEDAAVLDIFAGTGALGLEALSRGAARAVFVDLSRESIAVIRKNIALLGVTERTQVLVRDVLRPGAFLSGLSGPFDLVFADPPYRADALARTLENLASSGVLAPGATVVVEHALSPPLPSPPPLLALSETRRYGKTLVSFFSHVI